MAVDTHGDVAIDDTGVVDLDGTVFPAGAPTLTIHDATVLLAAHMTAPKQFMIDLTLRDGIDMSFCRGVHILDGTINVGGDVSFYGCKKLRKLHLSGHIGGDLDLRGTYVRHTPSSLIVNGKIYWPDDGSLVCGRGRTGIVGVANRWTGNVIGAGIYRMSWRHLKYYIRNMHVNEHHIQSETFAEACQRQQLSPEHLARRKIELRFMSLSSAAIAVVVLWGVLYNLPPRDIVASLNAIVMFIIAIAFLVNAGHYSFRHWQICNRCLGGLREWLDTPRAWLPW